MTRLHILKIATQEFATYGFDGVSMNKLAAKLEVNKATIYYHFKDKKSLYQEVIRTLILEKREELEAIVNDNIDSKEKFRQYITLLIKSIKIHPEIIQISLREMANFGADIEGEQSEDDFNQEILYLSRILNELNLKDKYKDIDPSIIKSMIFGTVNSYYAMQMSNIELSHLKNFDKNSDEILDYVNTTIIDILLDSLIKE